MRSNLDGAMIDDSILRAGNKFGHLAQTLGGTFTMDADMPHILALDPGGSTRTVLLPAEAKGLFFFIINLADADESLTVKEDSNSTTIGTVEQGGMGIFVCSGNALGGAATPTWYDLTVPAELDALNGLTSSAAELNILDGVTATFAELNYLDITTLGTGAASKAVVLDGNGRYRLPSTGTFFNAGKQMNAQGAPAAKTVTAAITAAELAGGLITTTGATGPSEHQLPTGTLLAAEFPGLAVGDSFDFTIINTGTGASDDATITVNTDVTIVGNPTVGALTDGTIISGSGTFRARYTATNTWVVYRIA